MTDGEIFLLVFVLLLTGVGGLRRLSRRARQGGG
jgi:hypothetical protein